MQGEADLISRKMLNQPIDYSEGAKPATGVVQIFSMLIPSLLFAQVCGLIWLCKSEFSLQLTANILGWWHPICAHQWSCCHICFFFFFNWAVKASHRRTRFSPDRDEKIGMKLQDIQPLYFTDCSVLYIWLCLNWRRFIPKNNNNNNKNARNDYSLPPSKNKKQKKSLGLTDSSSRLI